MHFDAESIFFPNNAKSQVCQYILSSLVFISWFVSFLFQRKSKQRVGLIFLLAQPPSKSLIDYQGLAMK